MDFTRDLTCANWESLRGREGKNSPATCDVIRICAPIGPAYLRSQSLGWPGLEPKGTSRGHSEIRTREEDKITIPKPHKFLRTPPPS